MKKILVTGGAGYVGARLVPRLLESGYKVSVLDLMIYGDKVLPEHENLATFKGDIRDQVILKEAMHGVDGVIHLACISNDPSFELNPELGKSINLDAFEPLVALSRNLGVQRFIYASSSSVYGIKAEKDVHEGMALEPLTDYSKFKAECEHILKKYESPKFTTVTVRPATVCGYSPRQRFDLVVNILTNLAFHNRNISVFGGGQLRPNIHIEDMVDAYLAILSAPKEKITGKIYNVGATNHSVLELAEIVRSVIGDDVFLKKTPTNDNRSYHISSKKILDEIGFYPKKTIIDAVNDLKRAIESNVLQDTLDNENYFNIRKMQSIEMK